MADEYDKENQEFFSPRSKDSPRKLSEFSSPVPTKAKQSLFNTPTHLIKKSFFSPSKSNSLNATPTRQRSDIKSDSKLRQIQLSRDKPTSSDIESKLVIWGTDISIAETKELIKSFILNNDEILEKINSIKISRIPFLDLNAHDITLIDQLVKYPQEIIPIFDNVINEIFFENNKDIILDHLIRVRIFGLKTRNMRTLNPEDIDQLISIKGMVVRASTIIPEIQEAYFQCYVCFNTHISEHAQNKIIEPVVCNVCNNSHTLILIHNLSNYSDKQIIKVQENPDEMPAGQTPHNVLIFAHADLVDRVQPGDRVTITGIYRVVPVKVNPKTTIIKSVYRTYIDAIHFEKVEKINTEITESQIEKIKQISELPNLFDKLANALAPSIYGNLDVKKGVLLQLFGASVKDFSNIGRSHFRSEINILLCGDPGTCKSQLLKFIHDLMPRGQYTSGKGSSAVGLTAYVTRDPDTRQLVLQTGSLVLSDNGICCIDEFDKMSESTRSVLHEVMEQQTLSIAKAGIICQLNARASILAAANPVKSKWDTKLTTIANIEMPHTLLSRFDLIFLILDHQSEQFDQNLARHLVSIYENVEHKKSYEIDLKLLKDYIGYAKQNYNPKLTNEAAEHLIQSYLEMRRLGSQVGSITAYPRQLESLIRLSEAHAKMRLSHTVDIEDVVEALRLHKEALMQSSTDPRTGMIDVNILAAGFSESDRKIQNDITKLIKTYMMSVSKSYTTHQYQQMFDIVRKTSSVSISNELFDSALRCLEDDHIISISDNKIIRFIQV